jgi:fatty acid desaturase
MRILAITLAIAGFATGLAAAWFWFRASGVQIDPVWNEREPVDPEQSQAGWIAGMLNASSSSARMNRVAAFLTGVAVILRTGSGVAGLFTQ